ncbi:MAG TPA: hypothetical protein DHW46_11840 [Halomonas sp.]|nr:hypothetical protein [Halomonas sp.]
MSEQQGTTQGYQVNPLVGVSAEETLANCLEHLEYLALTCEGMHQGFSTNIAFIRGALGHELAEAAKKSDEEEEVKPH